MTFFTKSWETDVSAITLTGILFADITLFVYPIPQLFAASENILHLLIYHCCAAAAFVAAALFLFNNTEPYGKIKEKIGFSLPDKKTVLTAIIAAPCMLAAASVMTWHWKFTLRRLEITFAERQWMLDHISLDDPIKLLLIAVLVIAAVPIAEELTFRRVIFGLLEKSVGCNAAGFISAGIFSAAHGFLAGAPGLLVMGLAFQWLYSKTNNLAAPITAHALCNAMTLLAALIF